MEHAISTVTGELVSRFISFLMNKYYSSHASLEEKMERLHHLLMRVHMVIEEADGRYITNSGMLMQLKTISEVMYRGYRVLDTFKYPPLEEGAMDEVRDSSSLSFAISLKRSRTISGNRKEKMPYLELHGALESLEATLANMKEFLVLLGGCDRMSRKPYDEYLYIDNFMFGRHTEKQKLLNFLLQCNPSDAPAVLPIIGGLAVGKKTLVAHVCNDERVRLHFSSILQLNGDNFIRILDHERNMSGKTLLVVEFVSDIDEKDWKTLYTFVTRVGMGSKVIIISKLERLARFGSVKPIFLNFFSNEEFRYLFKTLAFGSADPEDHPRLVQIGDEFVKELQFGWSLVPANAFADAFRRNLNVQFWLCILNRYKRVVEKNLFVYGVHPNSLFEQGHRIDITDFALHPDSALSIKPSARCSGTTDIPMRKGLPKVNFVELLVDPSVRPKGEFNLVSWESRIPPYTSFVHFIPSCAQDMPETPLSSRKRRGVPI